MNLTKNLSSTNTSQVKSKSTNEPSIVTKVDDID